MWVFVRNNDLVSKCFPLESVFFPAWSVCICELDDDFALKGALHANISVDTGSELPLKVSISIVYQPEVGSSHLTAPVAAEVEG